MTFGEILKIMSAAHIVYLYCAKICVEGSAKLKGGTRSLDYNFILLRLLRLQISVWLNYNVRNLLKLTLCTPGILSNVSQVAQKQSTQTRISNTLSWLRMAIKKGRWLSRLQESPKQVTADETLMLSLIRDKSETTFAFEEISKP